MWGWIKVPKGIALAAFLLPWMSVSCSNQKIASASGFGLAFGKISAVGEASAAADGGSINLWLILAIVAIGAGLFFAVREGRSAARKLLATSIAALVLIVIGTGRYSKDAILEKAAESSNDNMGMDQAALAMLEINWEIGYYIALLSLVAAAIMAWLVMSGKDDEAEAKIRAVAADVGNAAKSAGAQATAALNKDEAPAAATKTCPSCGKLLPADTKFCPDDGTALG